MPGGAADQSGPGGTPGPAGPGAGGFLIRAAAAGELPEIGQLRVTAYRASGFLRPPAHYAAAGDLAGLGADRPGDVLVAVVAGAIAGTVTVRVPPQPCEVARGPDEHEIRALAVLPQARGQHIGRALLSAAIDGAARRGAARVVLCTREEMLPARHLYAAAGFRRLPDRDIEPGPGPWLLAYVLDLAAGPAGSPRR